MQLILGGPKDYNPRSTDPLRDSTTLGAAVSKPTTIQTIVPSLLRIDSLFTNPATGAGVPVQCTEAGVIRLYAESQDSGLAFAGTVTTPYPPDLFIRGSGPLLYLPCAGRWKVFLQFYQVGVPADLGANATLLPGVTAELAASMMSGQQAHGLISGQVVIGAAASSNIPDPATATTFGFLRYFGLTNLLIYNSGAAAAFIDVGRIATANSQIIGAGATIQKNWNEIAGASVSAFSTAGTTLQWRVRYL